MLKKKHLLKINMEPENGRKFLSKIIIVRFHVKLWGCTPLQSNNRYPKNDGFPCLFEAHLWPHSSARSWKGKTWEAKPTNRFGVSGFTENHGWHGAETLAKNKGILFLIFYWCRIFSINKYSCYPLVYWVFSIKIWEMETFIGGSFGLLWVHFK